MNPRNTRFDRADASSSLAPHSQRHITPNATEEIKIDGYRATADDTKKCVWLQPELVAQIEFLEWTESDQ
jgi:hypothetical protein